MPWIIAAAKHGEFNRAILNTKRQGFNPFAPLWFDRKRKIRRPLFGRYFFVQLGMAQPRWGAVGSTRGVHYVITNNGTFSFVRASEIRNIRNAINEHGLVELEDRPTFAELRRQREARPVKLVKGTRVRVGIRTATGELKHYIGKCEGLTVNQQEKVALEYLGSIMVPADELELFDGEALAA